MFSVGILLLQMAFPSLRSDNNLVGQRPDFITCTLSSCLSTANYRPGIPRPAIAAFVLGLLTAVQHCTERIMCTLCALWHPA